MFGKMADKTKIVRISDRIETGIFEINKDVGLSKIKSLTVTNVSDSGKNSKKYKIAVSASHPEYDNISFGFIFDPTNMTSRNFTNAKNENICVGTPPKGEIKDIVIASLSHESYAYQISKKNRAWIHAETNPNNGEYLLWHYIYYGEYSPRLKWVLPSKCLKEKLWKYNKCKLCSGSKCEYLLIECNVCGSRTKNICPVCKRGVCNNHSTCNNGHYVLSKTGMYEGTCGNCGVKIPIGFKKCQICDSQIIRKY